MRYDKNERAARAGSSRAQQRSDDGQADRTPSPACRPPRAHYCSTALPLCAALHHFVLCKCKFHKICMSRRWRMLGTRSNVLRRRCRTEVSNKPIFASCREKQYSMPLLMVTLFFYVTLNNFVFAVSSRAVAHSKWRRRQMIWPRYRSIQTVRIGSWPR